SVRGQPSPGRSGESRVVREPYPRHQPAPRYNAPRHPAPVRRVIPNHRQSHVVVPRYPRYFSGIRVYRPHGHAYPGYGFYYRDNDAFRWLAFTAITLVMLDQLSEDQQRRHEDAQIRAAQAPLGESIVWDDGSVSGSVTAVKEGTSTAGRYCREFRQTVLIGNESEEAYGTACQNPDGSWEI
ncbi:unnamed protein product, partial [Cyprideis torosa]